MPWYTSNKLTCVNFSPPACLHASIISPAGTLSATTKAKSRRFAGNFEISLAWTTRRFAMASHKISKTTALPFNPNFWAISGWIVPIKPISFPSNSIEADCPGCNALCAFATNLTRLPTSVRERMLSKSPLRSKKSTFSALPVQDSDLAVPVITPARTNSWRMPNSALASGTKRNPVSNKRTRFCWRFWLYSSAPSNPLNNETRIADISTEIGFGNTSASISGWSKVCTFGSTKL